MWQQHAETAWYRHVISYIMVDQHPRFILPYPYTVLHLYQPFVVLNKADPLGWCQVEKGGARPTTALFQTTVWTWN
jgi:hypothetical protein